MTDKRYCYPPDYAVLINKFDIRDAETLEMAERAAVTERIVEGTPGGDFDLAHLKAIHHQLFQDVYDWAGDIREVEISKGGQPFMFVDRIQMGMEDVHRRLQEREFLQGLDRPAFALQAAEIIGDVNHVHPFREGNGRTQLLYLQKLSDQAGHPLELTHFTRETWIPASQAANNCDYGQMERCIATALDRTSSEDEAHLERDLDAIYDALEDSTEASEPAHSNDSEHEA